MSLDTSLRSLKIQMKNRVFNKAIQDPDLPTELYLKFKWFNYNSDFNISTSGDLNNFIQSHGISLALPQDNHEYPDILSALTGEPIFITEYPGFLKKYETLINDFYQKYVFSGKIIEYPLFFSSKVLIDVPIFPYLYIIKNTNFVIDYEHSAVLDFIISRGNVGKKEIKDHFKNEKHIFSRMDLIIYNLLNLLKIYKCEYDQIQGPIYASTTKLLLPYNLSSLTPSDSILQLITYILKSSVYINIIQLKRALKKHASDQDIDNALALLIVDSNYTMKHIHKQNCIINTKMIDFVSKL